MFRQFFPVAFGLMLAGCGISEPDYSGSYVGGDENALIQLQIVEASGGNINGSVTASLLDYNAGKLKQTTKAITGVRRGEQFSLLAHHNEFGAADAPLSLEAEGNSLILKVPATGQIIELASMDQNQYRDRLTKFASALNANDVGLLPDD
ncbi:hypothetical protein [Sphingopyxis sp. DBS4]|uniref:hypothetical protein n=1 Tax=Sphingopyxis sp. DBS4 TaxID=2968500 RepID=UPI00214B6F04|nr:hypothetical protein [Sphingopyxis sp. DBS4]